jgi:chromosome segregation ATPase
MYNQNYLPQTRDVIADNVSSSSSKDLLINQLKGRIFELEQNAQNYEQLNNSHLQLQTRFQALSNDKYKNECELRQKTEIQQKQITELQNENESLQLHLNDKIQINKKLYADNEILLKQIDALNAEVNILNQKLNTSLTQIQALKDEKNSYNKMNSDFTEKVQIQKHQIEKLFEDNKKLNSICKEQDTALNQYEDDKINLVSKIEEINYELGNLKGKIKSKEENVLFLQNQNEELKTQVNTLESKLRSYEGKCFDLEKQSEALDNELTNTKNKVMQLQSNNNHVDQCLKNREKDIEKYLYEIDTLNKKVRDFTEETAFVNNQKDKMNTHINEMNMTNRNLQNEIKRILNTNEQVKALLDRKERIFTVLKRNKMNIERSLNNFNSSIENLGSSIE